jgi:hypothetical protein
VVWHGTSIIYLGMASSAMAPTTRSIAGCFLFLILIQYFDLPLW